MNQQNINNKCAATKISKQQYDLVIMGGGCATFAFLLNAYRNDKLQEIAGKNGICILEKSGTFGSGTLEHNLIPSNTHTIGVMRYLMKEKEADMLPSHFEQYLKEGIPQQGKRATFDRKKVNDAILPCFEELKNTEISDVIFKRGDLTSSLQMFGYFLRLAGNSFLRHSLSQNINITFQPYTECVKIEDKTNVENPENQELYKIHYKNEKTGEESYVQGNNILMSMGGHQRLHPMYSTVPDKKRIMCQDALKQSGFLQLLDLIEANPDGPISIIGGSHSGFSVAYILLKGPDYYINNELENDNQYSQKRKNECPLCQKIGCSCFGDISPNQMQERIKNYECRLKKGQIKIFHRQNFRLSYLNKEQAQNEGYKDFDENCIHKFEGCVNAYTGLRGLTKKLYEDVTSKQEDRIEFVKFQDVEEIQDILDNSAAVIECLGYYSNVTEFQTKDNKQFEFPVDTDKFVKMDTKTHAVEGFTDIYGSGLGFGLQTHDELIGGESLVQKKVRADSLQVYLSRLSAKIINGMTMNRNFNQHN